ncbi:MAG: diacylglycerol kinase, partial [Bacteroidetes bacterium]|nr:diacylglycerol kinase [Fibrella sp.]
MAKPDLLAIINPHSGTQSMARKQQLREQVLRRATLAGYTPDVVLTTGPGHATELAAAAVKQGVGRVLAIGGDGTMNEVARALRHTATALGIVPIGSGNGLARHLNIPLNNHRAVDRALVGKPVVIDGGEVNEFPFLCTAGIGFDA